VLCSFIENKDVNFYKKIYQDFYCKHPIITFDGISVKFFVENFEHAFYKNVDRKLKDKSQFSYQRANRIYWIKWILQNPNADLYVGYNSNTKSYDNSRRVAICVDDYAVIIALNKTDNTKAKFITAYIANEVNNRGDKAIDLIRKGPKWRVV
jgi:hypothetical protein